MPESDLKNMKVADLKRELKVRGLSVSGNKNELQERLQTALLDNDLSLDDTAIIGEDLLEEDDEVLTDEDEAKILADDEHELLESPSTVPPASNLAATTTTAAAATAALKLDNVPAANTDTSAAPMGTKKIILKRSGAVSLTPAAVSSEDANANVAKENTPLAVPEKKIKLNQHNPITMSSDEDKAKATGKIAQLSMEERLQMRAKKFGLDAKASTDATKTGVSSNNSAGSTAAPTKDYLEQLKKRAERFGCVVSSEMAKLAEKEKLEKRKSRFAGTTGGGGSAADSTTSGSNNWDEKKLKRLERFKSTPVESAKVVLDK